MPTRYWLAKSDKTTPRNLERTPWSVTKNLVDNSEYALSYSSPMVAGDSAAEYRDIAIKDHKGHSRCTRVLNGIWSMAREVKPGDRFILIEYGEVVALGVASKAGTYTCTRQGVRKGYTYRLHKIKVSWTPFKGKAPNVSSARSPLNLKGYQSTPFIEVSDNPKLLAAVGLDGSHPIETIDHPRAGRPKKITRSGLIRDEDSDPYRIEGGVKDRFHRTIERCSQAAEDAKEQARDANRNIRCEACHRITKDDYGFEIIDAHHIVPLADLNGKAVTPSVSDFSMLCPTCHRAVHHVLRAKTHSGRDAIRAVANKIHGAK